MNDGLTRREILGGSAAAFAVSGSFAHATPAAKVIEPRTRERLTNWRFHLGHAANVEKDFGFGRDQQTFAKAGQSADAAAPAFDDSEWDEILVPHDWAVGLPFVAGLDVKGSDRGAAHGFKAIGREFPQNSIGWYRTPIEVTAADRSRRIWLEFDGVFRDAIVFVNGYDVVRNESGYAPFTVSIDDFLDYDGGPNVITVRADATLGEGWFYEGAGIYRDVDLVRADPVHIPQWGTFVRSKSAGARAQLLVTADVANSGARPVLAVLKQQVLDNRGRIVAECEDAKLSLTPGQTQSFEGSTFVDAPQLWSLETPHLYTLVSDVTVESRVVDRHRTTFGIRDIHFNSERGFFLNGKPVKLLGTANHQDHAGVGTGISDELHRWRVAALQEMGSNAWRSAHNPPATALLDACDEMGMLMICEQRINSSSAEARSELERMIRRDRNHPSVILWSLGKRRARAPGDSSRRADQCRASGTSA